jgi:hypothetical protein
MTEEIENNGMLRMALDFANRPHKFLFAETVGVFFVTDREVLLHYTMLEDAVRYDHFLVYGSSHKEIWRSEHFAEYGVDYDYYPRGRIAYDTEAKQFLIFGDDCIKSVMLMIANLIDRSDCDAVVFVDKNYRCHHCSPDNI